MKILFTGDWQIEDHPAHDEIDEHGRSIRFAKNIQVLKSMLRQAWDAGCRVLCHAGDLSEKASLRNTEADAIGSLFGPWIKRGGKIYGIGGNHDTKNYILNSSTFAAFHRMAPDSFNFAYDITYWPEIDVVALPYLYGVSPKEILERHSKVRDLAKDSTILMAHYGYRGVKVGANNSYLETDLLGPDVFFPGNRPYRRVKLGHIHKPQSLEVTVGGLLVPIDVIGSPMIMDQGEREDVKRYMIDDNETGSSESIFIPQPYAWKKIDLGRVSGSLEDAFLSQTSEYAPGTILSFKGEFTQKQNPKAVFTNLVEEGKLPKPFSEPDFRELLYNSGTVLAAMPELRGMSRLERIQAYCAKRFGLDPHRDLIQKAVEESLPPEATHLFKGAFRPLTLKARNIFSFEKLDYVFPTDAPVIIGGANGHGKTNFADLILTAFSGESLKGVDYSLVLRGGEKVGSLELVLGVEGQGKFVILREFKRTGQGVSQNNFSISYIGEDGKETSWKEGSKIKSQARLESVLGVSYESLQFMNVLVQAWHGSSCIVKLNSKQRKKYFTTLLGYEDMLKSYDALTIRRREADRLVELDDSAYKAVKDTVSPETESRLNREILELNDKLPAAKEKQALADARIRNVQDAQALDKSEYDRINKLLLALPDTKSKLLQIQTQISQAEESFKVNRRRMLDSIAEAANVSPDLGQWRKDLEDLFKALAPLKEKSVAITVQGQKEETALSLALNDYSKAEKLEKDLKAKYDQLLKANPETCSSCGSKLNIDQVKEIIASAKTDHEQALGQVEVLKLETLKAQNIVNGMIVDHSKLNLEISGIESKIKELDFKISQENARSLTKETLEKQAEEATKAHELQATAFKNLLDATSLEHAENEIKSDKFKAQIETIQLRLKEHEKNLQPLYAEEREAALGLQAILAMVSELDRNLSSHRELVKKVEDVKRRLEIDTEKAVILQKSCQVMDPASGLPYEIVSLYQTRIEEGVNRYLAALGRPDLNLKITFPEGDEESMELLISCDGDNSVSDVKAYSGGQGIRMEMAFKMAFQELIREISPSYLNFMLLDEPETGLEESGKRDLAKTLLQFQREMGSVLICISHDGRIKDAFPHQMEVVCNNRISSLIA